MQLVSDMASKLGMAGEEVTALVTDWQAKQAVVRSKVEAQENETQKARAEKRKALVPVWRCGVCGRADKNYIVCYVAPFIVRYEEKEV
jgi:hypothetical protein